MALLQWRLSDRQRTSISTSCRRQIDDEERYANMKRIEDGATDLGLKALSFSLSGEGLMIIKRTL